MAEHFRSRGRKRRRPPSLAVHSAVVCFTLLSVIPATRGSFALLKASPGTSITATLTHDNKEGWPCAPLSVLHNRHRSWRLAPFAAFAVRTVPAHALNLRLRVGRMSQSRSRLAWRDGPAVTMKAAGGARRSDRASPQQTATSSRGSESGAKRKPPTLPKGEFKPKQSLGQNYLTDQNYVMKICNHFGDTSERGRRVVELGPGTGALTQVLHQRFPDMLAVDIDQRAIQLLESSMPDLSVVLSDVLQVDYTKLAELRGGPLSIIGNLPYHITSQILFTLCDHYRSVRRAVVTMQLEVAQRIVAKPGTKQYGILSVVFQLYAKPRVLFQIPPTVFYPQPSVTSALISLDFTGRGPGVHQGCLKTVLSTAFQQRRKMLRQSLKSLLRAGQTLPEEFATKRPEQLQPIEFVALTKAVFGESAELPQGTKAWRGMRGATKGANAGGGDGEEGEGRADARPRGNGGEGGHGNYGGMV